MKKTKNKIYKLQINTSSPFKFMAAKKKIASLIILQSIFLFSGLKPAHAIMPPDFTYNFGFQITQFFLVIFISLSVVFGITLHFIKKSILKNKLTKTLTIFLAIIFIPVLSLFITYKYNSYLQKTEYKEWLEDSKYHSKTYNNADYWDFDAKIIKEHSYYDKLHFGSEEKNLSAKLDLISDNFVTRIPNDNSYSEFINSFYEMISEGNIDKAFSMANETKGYEEFKDFYKNTSLIQLDKFTRITDDKSSFELIIRKGNEYYRYGILASLQIKNNLPIKFTGIKKIALEPYNKEKNLTAVPENSNSIINAKNLQEKIIKGDDFLVLDIRSAYEFEKGRFPGSINAKYADLKAGRWIELAGNKPIYVFCDHGHGQSRETTEFLRTKNIQAFQVDGGIKEWVENNGAWEGEYYTLDYYNPENNIIINTEEVKQKMKEGIILIDCREPGKIKNSNFPYVKNLNMSYLEFSYFNNPTFEYENKIKEIFEEKNIIIICDDENTCTRALLMGVDLELHGINFLGRYNKPWEF